MTTFVVGASGREAPQKLRVLGVDPGSRVTGYGVVEVSGTRVRHLTHGCIRCSPGDLAVRLKYIHESLLDVIAEQQPDEAAIESVFVRRNVNSALVLGQARGVALLALAESGLPIREYAPAQVKSAIVGSGRAEKRQIQYLVRALLELNAAPKPDAADALAIALCHARLRTSLVARHPARGAMRGAGYRNYVA